jgi:hypothetical protein
MALVERHNLGSNYSWFCGTALKGTPTDGGDYYTFDGTGQGLNFRDAWGDETTIDIKVKVRVHNKSKGAGQIFWKSGGNGNGIAVGIDASNNLGIFGRSGSVTSITLSSANYKNDTWYYLYGTSSGIVLQEVNDPRNYTYQSGSITSGNGTSQESIGYSETQCPITGAGVDSSYFDGDVDYVELYTKGTLEFNNYVYEGYVYEEGSPVVRDLYLYRRDTGRLMDSTTSSGNGYYILGTTWSGTHCIVCLDDAGGTDYNDLIIGDVTPTLSGTYFTG